MNLLQLCPASEAEFREGVETLTGAIKEKLGLFQENYARLSGHSDFAGAANPDLARAMEELKSGAPPDWSRFVQEIGGRPEGAERLSSS